MGQATLEEGILPSEQLSGAVRRTTAKRRLALVMLACLPGPVADAGSVSWRYSFGNVDWGSPGNWAPYGVPTAADDVRFADLQVRTGDVIDLGGAGRPVRSFDWAVTTMDGRLTNGTLQIVGAGTSGVSLAQYPTRRLVLDVNLTLGDWTASSGVTEQSWSSNANLLLTGSIAKANPGQIVNLRVPGLTFTGAAAGHDDTTVPAFGGVTWTPPSPGTRSFGGGTIRLEGGSFLLRPPTDGAYTLTNPFVLSGADPSGFDFRPATAAAAGVAPAVTFAGPVTLGSDLKLSGGGTLAGTMTIAGGDRTLTTVRPDSPPVRITGDIVEDARGRKLTFANPWASRQLFVVSGPGNNWSGGTEVRADVEVAAGSSLGTGPVTLRSGARLRLGSAAGFAPGSVSGEVGSFVEVAGSGPAALAVMNPASARGVFGTLGEPAGFDLAAGGYADLFVGTVTPQTWTTGWRPHGDVYRLAGAVTGTGMTSPAEPPRVRARAGRGRDADRRYCLPPVPRRRRRPDCGAAGLRRRDERRGRGAVRVGRRRAGRRRRPGHG
jgi:hypothetical protein